jgi:hypothetical protein
MFKSSTEDSTIGPHLDIYLIQGIDLAIRDLNGKSTFKKTKISKELLTRKTI